MLENLSLNQKANAQILKARKLDALFKQKSKAKQILESKKMAKMTQYERNKYEINWIIRTD